MNHALGLGFMCLPILVLAAWQFRRSPEVVTVAVSYLAALEGAKLLREWCSWLATLSTAAIGVAAFNPSGFLHDSSKSGLAVLAVLSFAISLIFTATLLLALPSLVSRLASDASAGNDLYELPAFLWAPAWSRRLLRVGFLAAVQYYFFVAAIALVAYLFANVPTK